MTMTSSIFNGETTRELALNYTAENAMRDTTNPLRLELSQSALAMIEADPDTQRSLDEFSTTAHEIGSVALQDWGKATPMHHRSGRLYKATINPTAVHPKNIDRVFSHGEIDDDELDKCADQMIEATRFGISALRLASTAVYDLPRKRSKSLVSDLDRVVHLSTRDEMRLIGDENIFNNASALELLFTEIADAVETRINDAPVCTRGRHFLASLTFAHISTKVGSLTSELPDVHDAIQAMIDERKDSILSQHSMTQADPSNYSGEISKTLDTHVLPVFYGALFKHGIRVKAPEKTKHIIDIR